MLVEANVRNAGPSRAGRPCVSPCSAANSGQTLDGALAEQEIAAGRHASCAGNLLCPTGSSGLWKIRFSTVSRRRWRGAGSSSFDEQSTRCGFRDFRYENDAFRLNGKRVYLKGSLLLPIIRSASAVMPREDFLRRDMTSLKLMGLNTFRALGRPARSRSGGLRRVGHSSCRNTTEHPDARYAAARGRFDQSMTAVIRRDRNHPSIVIWCLLNEIRAGSQFDCAADSLPLVKFLDDTRMVWLNSGGFDLKFARLAQQSGIAGLAVPDGQRGTQRAGAHLRRRIRPDAGQRPSSKPTSIPTSPYRTRPWKSQRMRTLGSCAARPQDHDQRDRHRLCRQPAALPAAL